MSLEAALIEHAAALKANTAILERVVAGQGAAMERLENAKPATTRGAKKAAEATVVAEPAAKTEEKVAETPKTEAAPAVPKIKLGDGEALKAYVSAWTGSTDDAEERAKRVDLLKAIAAHLGVAPKFGELMGNVREVQFYIERAKAGLPVDFNADYDFDGSPDQGGSEPAADESDFD